MDDEKKRRIELVNADLLDGRLRLTGHGDRIRFMAELYAALHAMTDEQREAIFADLAEHFCMYCGAIEPEGGPRCQCWNDD